MSNNPYSTPQNSWNQQTHNPYAQSAQAHRTNQQSQSASFGQPGGFRTPAHQRPSQNTRRAQMKRGLTYAVGYVVLIWAVHIISTLIFGGALVYFGIHPLELSSLPYIFTSPILHVDFSHVLSNTVPGAIFAFLIGCSSHRVFWEVTAFVVLIGGLGTWLFGGPGTNHVGASMLVYGWLAYLLVRGIFNRSGAQIALGVVLGLLYSGLVWGVLPVDEGISWQAHLFGAIGGIAAGMLITSDDPPALRAKREAKKAEKLRAERTVGATAAQQQPYPQPGPHTHQGTQPDPHTPRFPSNPPQSGPFYNPPRA
ncbi:Membrane associated serine protease, rhomboid family [Corynebacterium appendicis CIP 107643]|uniref:Membrane associated serine protease, rhomboid family n=1 Tax=Corynebacterium appendicis CIP 107643 TaxID=1161099 RepID=A0A1N7K7Q7_9CORY|nr:Rhomboid family protein [Corynebacterium appendicis CIP 107643]SIS57596.1 Membrane associated serine protease, rhomboid family [Corynebacterium appendicis CIP 107643]